LGTYRCSRFQITAPRKPKTYPITHDRDERNGRRWIEWFDEVHRLDHVRSENEVEDRLRPADENKNRPNHMLRGDTNPTLWGLVIISQCHSDPAVAGEESRIKS
jgi:hypothetical protein